MALGQSLVTEVDGHVVMFKVVTKWVVLPITNYQLPNGPIKAGRRWGSTKQDCRTLLEQIHTVSESCADLCLQSTGSTTMLKGCFAPGHLFNVTPTASPTCHTPNHITGSSYTMPCHNRTLNSMPLIPALGLPARLTAAQKVHN